METLQPIEDDVDNERALNSPDLPPFRRNIFDALARVALPDSDRDFDIRSDNNTFDSGWTTLKGGGQRWDVEVVD